MKSFILFTPHLNPLPKGEERTEVGITLILPFKDVFTTTALSSPSRMFSTTTALPSPFSTSVVLTKDCQERVRVR